MVISRIAYGICQQAAMSYLKHKRGLQVHILLSGSVCSVIMNFHTVRIPFVTFGIEPKARMVSVGGGSRACLQCNCPDWQVFTLSISLMWHTAIGGDKCTQGNSEAFASSTICRRDKSTWTVLFHDDVPSEATLDQEGWSVSTARTY